MDLMTANELPKLVWSGYESLIQVELWKHQKRGMEEIASAFGVSRQTLYTRIKKAKAALEQSGTITTDEEEGGKRSHSTSMTDEETQ
jgi:transcriptional antiterminator